MIEPPLMSLYVARKYVQKFIDTFAEFLQSRLA